MTLQILLDNNGKKFPGYLCELANSQALNKQVQPTNKNNLLRSVGIFIFLLKVNIGKSFPFHFLVHRIVFEVNQLQEKVNQVKLKSQKSEAKIFIRPLNFIKILAFDLIISRIKNAFCLPRPVVY
jgi:hypothetical protein